MHVKQTFARSRLVIIASIKWRCHTQLSLPAMRLVKQHAQVVVPAQFANQKCPTERDITDRLGANIVFGHYNSDVHESGQYYSHLGMNNQMGERNYRISLGIDLCHHR